MIIDEAALRSSDLPLISSNFCRRVVLGREVNPWFVYYQLVFKYLAGDTKRFQTATTNIRNLNFTDYLAETTLAVAPLPEQHRIVSVIEEQFSRLDAGMAALDKTRHKLRQIWIAGLHAAQSKAGLADYDLVTFGEVLSAPLRNGYSARADPAGKVPVLTLTAVTLGDFSRRNMKMTGADPHRVRDLWIQPGDLLIERSNTKDLVGTARLYRGPGGAAVFPDLVIRARVDDRVIPEYAETILRSPESRRYFRDSAKGISGTMPKIDQGTIERLPFRLPPIDVQGAFVADLEERDRQIRELEDAVAVAFRQSTTLRFSILAAAFSGTLAQQDSKSEPASVGPQRIAAGQASSKHKLPMSNTEPDTVSI